MKTWLTDEELTMYHLQGYKIIVDDPYIRFIVDGKLHREDGPAIIRPDGSMEWWLDGRKYTHRQWLFVLEKRQEA